MKGIMITYIGEVSEKAKEKLRNTIKRRNERLERLAEDYKSGRLKNSK